MVDVDGAVTFDALDCHVFPRSQMAKIAVEKLRREIDLLKHNPPSTVSQLMGAEGRVGYAHFDAWRTCKLSWKGMERNPVPDDWHRIDRRSSKSGTTSHPNRNATHPVNAMLNYAYAILESQVRMTCRATKHVGGLR